MRLTPAPGFFVAVQGRVPAFAALRTKKEHTSMPKRILSRTNRKRAHEEHLDRTVESAPPPGPDEGDEGSDRLQEDRDQRAGNSCTGRSAHARRAEQSSPMRTRWAGLASGASNRRGFGRWRHSWGP